MGRQFASSQKVEGFDVNGWSQTLLLWLFCLGIQEKVVGFKSRGFFTPFAYIGKTIYLYRQQL